MSRFAATTWPFRAWVLERTSLGLQMVSFVIPNRPIQTGKKQQNVCGWLSSQKRGSYPKGDRVSSPNKKGFPMFPCHFALWPARPKPRLRLAAQPPLLRLPRVLSTEQCAELIQASRVEFGESKVRGARLCLPNPQTSFFETLWSLGSEQQVGVKETRLQTWDRSNMSWNVLFLEGTLSGVAKSILGFPWRIG